MGIGTDLVVVLERRYESFRIELEEVRFLRRDDVSGVFMFGGDLASYLLVRIDLLVLVVDAFLFEREPDALHERLSGKIISGQPRGHARSNTIYVDLHRTIPVNRSSRVSVTRSARIDSMQVEEIGN